MLLWLGIQHVIRKHWTHNRIVNGYLIVKFYLEIGLPYLYILPAGPFSKRFIFLL